MKHGIEELDIGQLDLIESEGKTMNNDLISRQAVIKAIHDEREWLDANIQSAQHHYHMMNETAKILGIIGNLPAVQPVQKTGRWIDDNCSECGQYVYHGDANNYCPNCGAKMESENKKTW